MKANTTVLVLALTAATFFFCATLALHNDRFLSSAGITKMANGRSVRMPMPLELHEATTRPLLLSSLMYYASGQTLMLLFLGALKRLAVIDFDRIITITL